MASLVLSGSELTLIDQHYKETYQNLQKLLPNTPHCVVFFLGGCLPARAVIHLRQLSLFGMVARLPNDPLNIHARKILTEGKRSSKSWFCQIRDLCLEYQLPHPLQILDNPPSKQKLNKLVKSSVLNFWENKLRGEASVLPSLVNFRPFFMSLNKPHPIWTTAGRNPHEVSKAVQQARFLSGRYRTESLASHWSQNPNGYCLSQTCTNKVETVEHILIHCDAYNDSKAKLYSLWLSTINPVVYKLVLEALSSPIKYLLQFILDCSSLPSVISATQKHGRVILEEVFYLTRTWCFIIHRQRMRMLGRWNFQ